MQCSIITVSEPTSFNIPATCAFASGASPIAGAAIGSAYDYRLGDGYVGLNFGDYKTGKSLFNFGLETTAFGLTGYGMGKGLNNLQFTGRASLRDMVNMGLKKGGITTFTNVGVGTATFIVNMELNNIVNNTENATATPDPAH